MAWQNSDRRAGLPRDWNRRRQRVLDRDDHRCRIRGPKCIGKATDVDHIIRGDNHDEVNLQAACRPCHNAKTSRESNEVQTRMRKAAKRPPPRHPGRRD